MNYKIAFACGAWRTVQADCHAADEGLVVFIKDGQPVLTAVLHNVVFFEPAQLEIPAPRIPLSKEKARQRHFLAQSGLLARAKRQPSRRAMPAG